jgi:hypothetical protein
MNTGRVLQNIQSGHDLTKKHSEASPMAKGPSKINNFEGLEKVCHTFPQTFLWKRHDMPHQTSIEERSAKHRYSSNMAEHDSSQISSLTILDQAKKVKSPPLNLPLFKTFSNVYLFPDLTIFVLTTLFRRRFDRTFREI